MQKVSDEINLGSIAALMAVNVFLLQLLAKTVIHFLYLFTPRRAHFLQSGTGEIRTSCNTTSLTPFRITYHHIILGKQRQNQILQDKQTFLLLNCVLFR